MDIDGAKRFEAELEFVQSLASPDYLNWLAQNKYFEDESFVEFLSYLQYWKRPEYAKFIIYPHCLYFLELLQEADFRKAIANPQFKEVSSSSSSTDEEEENDRIDRAYAVLDIAGLLRSRHHSWEGRLLFFQALRELTAILSNDIFWKSAPRRVRHQVEGDVSEAVEKADWEDGSEGHTLLAGMVQAMNRQKQFSKKKRAGILSAYRNHAVLASRRNRRKKSEGALPYIPDDILFLIFKCLDPKSLARCRMTCKHWGHIASDDSLWRPLLIRTFGLLALRESSGDEDGMAMTFAGYATRYPAMLLPYETKRVCIQSYVRTMNENRWSRLCETPHELGISARAADNMRVPMFLAADEVALWLTNPSINLLLQFRRTWKEYIPKP